VSRTLRHQRSTLATAYLPNPTLIQQHVATSRASPGQDRLYLAFNGDDLSHRSTKIAHHDEQQRCRLDYLMYEAMDYWAQIPMKRRDLGQTEAPFIRWFV